MATHRIVLALLLALLALPIAAPRQAQAAPEPAPAADPPATAPCYVAAIAAAGRAGFVYSQGGHHPADPVDGSGYPAPRNGPNSFDCSGLVWWAYATAGVSIGQTTYDQVNNGTAIDCNLSHLNGSSTTCWAPGDLIFLRTGSGQHVAIYIGSGLFMDCYNHSVGCIAHEVQADTAYTSGFWHARRITSGCEGMAINPGVPISTPSSPLVIDQIPDLLPYVTWHLPRCGTLNGDCATTEIVLPRTPPPETSWYDFGSVIRWLAWSLEDTIIDLLCWLLSIFQRLVDIFAAAVNMFIYAINAIWRLFVLGWYTMTTWALMLWAWLDLLQSSLGTLDYGLAVLVAWLLAATVVIAQIAALVWAAVSVLLSIAGQILGLIGWIGGLALGLISSIFLALQATTAPAQLAPNPTTPVYPLLRGALEAIRDNSATGWLIWLGIAMAYVAFVTWLSRFLSASKTE